MLYAERTHDRYPPKLGWAIGLARTIRSKTELPIPRIRPLNKLISEQQVSLVDGATFAWDRTFFPIDLIEHPDRLLRQMRVVLPYRKEVALSDGS